MSQHFQDAKTTADMIEVYEKGLLKQADEACRESPNSASSRAHRVAEVLDAQRVQRQILLDYAQAQFDLSMLLALQRVLWGGRMISGTPQARRSSNPFRPYRNRAFASMPLGGLLACCLSGRDVTPLRPTQREPIRHRPLQVVWFD